MRRRCFLKIAASGSIAVGAGRFVSAATEGPAAVSIVVTDISAQTDARNLFAVLETLSENGLFVTCAVRPPDGRLDGYSAILQDLVAQRSGLEIALDLPDLARLSAYFQARAAFDARRDLSALVGDGRPFEVSTVLCAPSEAPTAPIGVRSAGIRNVLVRPDAAGPPRTEAWPDGVARFFGGTVLSPWSHAVPVRGGETGLFYISAKTFASVPQSDLRRWATRLAAEFFEAELAGRITTLPVSERQLRDNFEFTRYLTLRLLNDGSAPMRRLAEQLGARGIPVRLEGIEAPRGYWVAEPNDDAGGSEVTRLDDIDCAAGEHLSLSVSGPLQSGVAVRLKPGPEQPVGLDACAALELRDIQVDRPVRTGARLVPAGVQNDWVLTIGPGALKSRVEETALLMALEALGQDGVTRFVPLDQLANALLSQGPIDRRFRRTNAAVLERGPDQSAVSPAAREAYLDDARLAWRYIEDFSDANTGLCPATVNVHTGEDALTWLTMWDVGSQINALVAAHRLGLIGAEQYTRSARLILFQIAGRRSQDRLLPNGVIRTDRVRAGSSDFDGCDAGRLLAALDNLRRHSDLEDEILALVSSWDLDKIVIDRVIYSVQDGELLSTYKSHCAHYSARAFERWGFEVASPYRTMVERSPADGEMALLEAVSGIGPIGAEPLLLEAMELGMSPESAYLADVLDVAQVEEYETSGNLMAVSEMPISKDPWFIYLGLQIGRRAREWGIDTVDGRAEYQTRTFLDENMALSSKAAYLWAAYRPGTYTDTLVAYIRDHAQLPIGFASNVRQAGGGVAAPFTDLNTNAIILQAIAHKLAD